LDKRLIIPVLAAIALIITIFVAWNIQPFVQSQEVYVGLETDKRTYVPGEKVKITFSLVNNKPSNISIPSLGYSLEVSGSKGVVLIVTESHSSSEPVSVDASSEILVSTYMWDQRDMNGNQVPSGTYTIRVTLLGASYHGTTEIEIK
jgi:flagellar hook assembly protein FlgD